MRFVGIDPGVNGAMACLLANGKILDLIPMPTIGKEVAPHIVAQVLDAWSEDDDPVVFIEDVHSMPGQGVASSFKFGKAFGTVIGVVAALEMSMQFVRPVRWKPEFRLTGKEKDASRLKAIELWPGNAQRFKLKKDVDKAEAALIAEYGRRIW